MTHTSWEEIKARHLAELTDAERVDFELELAQAKEKLWRTYNRPWWRLHRWLSRTK